MFDIKPDFSKFSTRMKSSSIITTLDPEKIARRLDRHEKHLVKLK
jgi:hypothetical protein